MAGVQERVETDNENPNASFDSAFNRRRDPILVKGRDLLRLHRRCPKESRSRAPHWDFDKVRADAKAAWNKELSKIEVSGGTPEQTTNFYTALYHTMIHPNVFNDVDGRYKGHDGKIHQLPDTRTQLASSEARSTRETWRGHRKS